MELSQPRCRTARVHGHDNAINALAAPAPGGGGSTGWRASAAGGVGNCRLRWLAAHLAHEKSVCRTAPGAPGWNGRRRCRRQHRRHAAGVDYLDDSTIQLWDARTGTKRPGAGALATPVSAIAYSPTEAVLWAGAKDGSVTAWDTHEGALLRRWRGSDDAISTVAASPMRWPSGQRRRRRHGSAVESKSGDLVRELAGHTNAVIGVAFTADGKSLVSGGRGSGTLRIWDVATGRGDRRLQGPAEGLLDVAVQPPAPGRSERARDGAVWVWNADALAFEPARLSRHGTEVNAVNFSADGQVLASAGSDGAVYLWSTVNPSAEPDVLAGRGSSVNGVSFAPDGTWLVSGSGDGTIRGWSLNVDELIDEACHTAGRNFTLDEWTQYFPTDVSSYRKTCPDLLGPMGP